MPKRFVRSLVALAVFLLTACERGVSASSRDAQRYVPRTRHITITTVPLLVKEQRAALPFLKEDFAKGGVLDGKEVYAFSPATITVVEGDTVQLTLINPEDDDHSFVLPDFVIPMPPQKAIDTSYVARRAGIYPILCAVQSHLPMMSGQLIVLSPAAVATSASTAQPANKTQ